MNDFTRRIISRRSTAYYPERNYREHDDCASRGDYEVYGNFESYDGRRGVRGTGRYGIGGRDYYHRHDRSMGQEYDYNEYADGNYRDMQRMDYGETKLSKHDMQEWKRNLENADGSIGEHFRDMQQILNVAQQHGVQYKGYDEKDLCLTTNMLYSDYCEALRPYITPDKELHAYVRMAKAFLEDEDGARGKNKLYLYYNCIVNDEE